MAAVGCWAKAEMGAIDQRARARELDDDAKSYKLQNNRYHHIVVEVESSVGLAEASTRPRWALLLPDSAPSNSDRRITTAASPSSYAVKKAQRVNTIYSTTCSRSCKVPLLQPLSTTLAMG
jgi:hypothetical protein